MSELNYYYKNRAERLRYQNDYNDRHRELVRFYNTQYLEKKKEERHLNRKKKEEERLMYESINKLYEEDNRIHVERVKKTMLDIECIKNSMLDKIVMY